MTGYKRGDIILVGFVFSDESGEKRRPAVVVSSDAYQRSRQEAIIAAITSSAEHHLVGDHLIVEWEKAGLLFPSVATGIIRTVKHNMMAKKLGTMPKPDMQAIEDNLRDILELGSHSLSDTPNIP